MSEGGPVDENLCEGDPAWDEPKCPVCGSRRITRSGVQKFGVTERWRGDELTDWDLGEADEWVETRGMACNACGHTAESAEEWLHGSTGPPEYWFCAQCNWVGLDSEADQQGDDAEPAERLCPRCDDARALWAVRQDGVVARISMRRQATCTIGVPGAVAPPALPMHGLLTAAGSAPVCRVRSVSPSGQMEVRCSPKE
jgi:hypothetical protein